MLLYQIWGKWNLIEIDSQIRDLDKLYFEWRYVAQG